MLEITADPLKTEFFNANPNEFNMDNVFPHDGAPIHYFRKVINYLDNNFHGN